jgi:hypothetical protein
MDEIDHEGAEPVYRQLAVSFAPRSNPANYAPAGGPSERIFTQRYGVAVGTVKKAVEVLRPGLVHTVIVGHLRPLMDRETRGERLTSRFTARRNLSWLIVTVSWRMPRVFSGSRPSGSFQQARTQIRCERER